MCSYFRTANDVVDAAATASPVAPTRHDASDPIQKVSTAAQKGTGAENKKVGPVSPHSASDKCAGCSEELKEGQALMALDKQVRILFCQCIKMPFNTVITTNMLEIGHFCFL